MRATLPLKAPWLMVSPSSRGIGLNITHHLLRSTTAPIFATTRSQDLEEAKKSILKDAPDGGKDYEKRLHVARLDVTDESTIEAAASKAKELFGKDHLHLAFMIPGILHAEKSPAQVDAEKALQTFQINSLGPLLLAKHFLRFLPTKSTPESFSPESDYKGLNPERATFALMSARVGSVSDNRRGGWFSYRASKSAVNQLVKSLDIATEMRAGDRSVVLGLHPGTVKTNLSKDFWDSLEKEQLFEPDYAAGKLLEVVKGDKGRGRIWDWKGEEILP